MTPERAACSCSLNKGNSTAGRRTPMHRRMANFPAEPTATFRLCVPMSSRHQENCACRRLVHARVPILPPNSGLLPVNRGTGHPDAPHAGPSFFQKDNELQARHMPNAGFRPYFPPQGHCVSNPGNDAGFTRVPEAAVGSNHVYDGSPTRPVNPMPMLHVRARTLSIRSKIPV